MHKTSVARKCNELILGIEAKAHFGALVRAAVRRTAEVLCKDEAPILAQPALDGELRAIGKRVGVTRLLKEAARCTDVLEEEARAGLQRCGDVCEHPTILRIVHKVPEAGEEGDRAVKDNGRGEGAHVSLEPGRVDLCRFSTLACDIEKVAVYVDTGDVVAAQCKLDAVPPVSTGDVEHLLARSEPQHPLNGIDLAHRALKGQRAVVVEQVFLAVKAGVFLEPFHNRYTIPCRQCRKSQQELLDSCRHGVYWRLMSMRGIELLRTYSHTAQLLFVVGIGVTLHLLFGVGDALLGTAGFLPLFGGSSTDDSSSDGANSANSSDSDGTGGDSDGGGTGGTACNDSSCCDSSCSDSCNSGDGSDGTSSSPFLFCFDGAGYRVENDVLVGPRTYVETPEQGRAQYTDGRGGMDSYRIDGGRLQAVEGKVKLALKEIEPEETFLDRLRLTKLVHPKGLLFAAQPSREESLAFSQSELEQTRGVKDIVLHATRKESGAIATALHKEASEEYFLESGDSFELRGVLTDTSTPALFCLRSRYRDWVAGRIESLEHTVQNTVLPKEGVRSPLQLVRAGAMLVMMPLVWVASSIGLGGSSESDDISTLTKHFGFRSASADSPHYGSKSLVVDYWDWARGYFVQLAVVQPRYQKAVLEAVELPEAARDEQGNIHIRVTATKRHAVDLATFVVPSHIHTESDFEQTELSLTEATHSRKDVVTDLTKKDAAETDRYTHLVPGDVLELEFSEENTDLKEGHVTSYVLELDGFYSKLTPEGEALAGDWTKKLDKASYEQLKSMYALSAYGSTTRSPVVS